MTTLRRLLEGAASIAVVLTIGAMALAAVPTRSTAQDSPVAQQGIASVTDADGNPVPLREPVAGTADPSSTRPPVREIRRGQAWWPYAGTLPPYTFVNTRAEAMTADEIQVNGVALLDVRDVEATLRLIPTDLRLATGVQRAQKDGFYLVKIAGRSRTQEQIDALTDAGAVLGEYMNVNTYIAKIPAGSLASVEALPFVTFVGDYHPAYKISPRIGLESIPVNEAIDAATGKGKPWLFEVTLHRGAELKDALDGFAKIGIVPDRTDIVSSDDLTVVYVAAAPEAVLSIARLPEVKWIAEKTYASLLASAGFPATIPMILQNNGAYTANKALGWKLWTSGIDGGATDQIVTVMDTGLNTNMEHFSQSTASVGTIGPSHRKVVGYDLYGGDQCVLDVNTSDSGHGTWTSQHAVGSISNMTGSPDVTHTPAENYDNGIARGAKVYFQDIGDSAGAIHPPSDLGPSIVAAIVKGSFVQNDSWGTSSPTYDTTATLLDTALFNNPDFVVTVAVGNRGWAGQSTIGSPSTAKNCIAVGGNDVSSPDKLFIDCNWNAPSSCDANDLGSSRGPVATSNRVKPDIMTFVYSSAVVGDEQGAIDEPLAMCQTDGSKSVYWQYVNSHGFGGTSMAAPEVAGLAALVRDYFMQGFYPTGTATPANAITPSGSLVKAVILASGENMATTSSPTTATMQARYSNDVGYGRANLPGVLHIGGGAPYLWVRNNVTLGQAGTHTTFYNINGNGMPLRVLLTWYDAAGNAIQENADLKVTIGGNVYLGNSFDASSGWSKTGGVADATNNTEGVFVDAAHLPASGTVKVEVIGANNPGGMNYSLVVSGNVSSATEKLVSFDKGQYTCAGPINITVTDPLASSPVPVTLTSRNSASTVIDSKIVSCTGAGGAFTGSIFAGSGLAVADGGTITATYSDATPLTATVACRATVADNGFIIGGGCDNAAAGTDNFTGPLTNGGVNEFYTKYMDAGEYSSYKFAFINQTGAALTDVNVALSFSGSGALKMSALNGPIHVGTVAAGATAGGVFQLYTDTMAAGLTSVNLDFDITSPADGYTMPTRLTQVQLLQANDVIARQNRCSTFDGSLAPWVESVVSGGGRTTNPWRWSGSATSPGVVGSENRTDGLCHSSVGNAAAMVGNSGTINIGANFNGSADSILLQNFQPALTGNGPSGKPYHYAWRWHSFYHASELLGDTTGVWGVFYNDKWNTAVNPTADQVKAFTYKLCCYHQADYFDYGGTWNWEAANSGTPDNPNAATPAPNQMILTFSNVTGLATAATYFAYGHEHADRALFPNEASTTSQTRRDVALDDDDLVYDEYYAAAQGAACVAGTQVGQVAFDQVAYGTCPAGPAVLSVVDANGSSGMTVTVTSPGTGDSELVSLTGSAPYFSGTLTLSTATGVGANNGTLFVLPAETISANYADSSPVGSSAATATIACIGGDVVVFSKAQVADNGDNDGIADNNECVTIDITIKNNSTKVLTNTNVRIFSTSPYIDLIPDDRAAYGTVDPGLAATNPANDRFTFHVASSVLCSDPANPLTAKFIVAITADGLNGPSTLQTFTINLDLDVGAGTTTYTQTFAANPNWTMAVTPPDNPGCTTHIYTNDFHWCALCGNSGGGYGAWVGNAAFGTAGQNYTVAYNSSTLYSPVFTAGSTSVGLQFRTAYRTEALDATTNYDGAIVQYQLGTGSWTTLAYSTPAQSATYSGNACSPIVAASNAWGGTATGTAWTLTNTPSIATSAGQNIQFRWRLGGDVSVNGTTYGGFGVDDVSVTGLRPFMCEPTRNTGLPICTFCSTNANGTACDDGNGCTASDVCASGTCAGTPITVPVEAHSVNAAADKVTYTWSAVNGATRYDALRGGLASFPVGPGGGDESCFDNLAAPTFSDTATPSPGTGYWYLSRGENTCGNGTYGTQSNATPRTSTTCP